MVAEKVAKELGADTLRIEPVKAYPDKGMRKFLWGGKSAVMGEMPKLNPYEVDINKYDQVVFGFPVWAGNVTPPIRTFVNEQAEFLKKCKIAAFACQSGSGGEKALDKLKELVGINELTADMILIDPMTKESTANDEKIKSFCEAIK